MSHPNAGFERRSYPSDISGPEWERVSPMLPGPRGNTGRKRRTDLREVVNAVNYRWHTGCGWRMLPHDFPPWGTVYAYFRTWDRAGLLPHLRRELLRRKQAASPPPNSNPASSS
jgi:putative transposase